MVSRKADDALQTAVNQRMLAGTEWSVIVELGDYDFTILVRVDFNSNPVVGMCVGFDFDGSRTHAWMLELIGAIYKYCIEGNMECQPRS